MSRRSSKHKESVAEKPVEVVAPQDAVKPTKPIEPADRETTVVPEESPEVEEVEPEVLETEPDNEPVEASDPMIFVWKDTEYDFALFDDVRVWQRETDGKQQCWLFSRGNAKVDVPADNHIEAVQFQSAFHAVRPRLG